MQILSNKFGEDLINEIYLTGKMSLLQERLRERFNILSQIADMLDAAPTGERNEIYRFFSVASSNEAFDEADFHKYHIVIQLVREIAWKFLEEEEDMFESRLDEKARDEIYNQKIILRYFEALKAGKIQEDDLELKLTEEISAVIDKIKSVSSPVEAGLTLEAGFTTHDPRPTRSGPDSLCLIPDSLIYLADGGVKPLIHLKPWPNPSSIPAVEQGKEGDMVLSLNEATGKLEPHKVVALVFGKGARC